MAPPCATQGESVPPVRHCLQMPFPASAHGGISQLLAANALWGPQCRDRGHHTGLTCGSHTPAWLSPAFPDHREHCPQRQWPVAFPLSGLPGDGDKWHPHSCSGAGSSVATPSNPGATREQKLGLGWWVCSTEDSEGSWGCGGNSSAQVSPAGERPYFWHRLASSRKPSGPAS